MEKHKIFGPGGGIMKIALVSVLLVASIAFIVAQTILTGWKINEINTPYSQQITVEGEGTASVSPDTASLSFGVETTADSVGDAQEQNSETVNALLEDLRDLNIGDEDIETSSYNVYEDQVWNPDARDYETVGWVVSQRLSITIRDLSIAPEVVTLAGTHDVTNLSSLNFFKDDVTQTKQDARDEAIEAAKRQAKAIARSLDVEIYAVVDYYEWSYGDDDTYYDKAYGYGEISESSIIPPELESGSEEITVSVSITYELR